MNIFFALLTLCFFLYEASIFVAASNIFYGLNYGVNIENCPTYETVKQDFRILSQYTNVVRIYSVQDCDMGRIALKASQANKMRLYMGIWIDKTDGFEQEFKMLQDLIRSNSFYNVNAIIVGSEVLFRGDMDSGGLVSHINDVKNLVHSKGVQVTTADVFYKISPEIVNAVDFLMISIKEFSNHIEYVKSISNEKIVYISETGWPDQGSNFGNSMASPENQKYFLLKSLCMTRTQNIDMIWFSAIDESYKRDVESHFGFLNTNRQLKNIFQYESLTDPCSF
ncbi:MAG: glycoside hydrolase superfamily [Benjaminiella poitrasii]|nr:MAG: glycoside hydrolase superfamily [Benjaminiella poitrasii]